jgi:hypothetical protein
MGNIVRCCRNSRFYPKIILPHDNFLHARICTLDRELDIKIKEINKINLELSNIKKNITDSISLILVQYNLSSDRLYLCLLYNTIKYIYDYNSINNTSLALSPNYRIGICDIPIDNCEIILDQNVDSVKKIELDSYVVV